MQQNDTAPGKSKSRPKAACNNRSLLTVASLASALCLGGCFDAEQEIAFKPDKSVYIDTALFFDKEAEDVAGFIEEVGSLGQDAEKLKNGICGMLQEFAADNPAPNTQVASKQFSAGGSFVCQARISFDDIAQLELNPQIGTIFQMKRVGEGRLLLSINLSSIPDFAETVQNGMVQSMLADPQLPGAKAMPPEQVQTIWKKFQAASNALTRIFLRNRKFTLTVVAPKITETNGILDESKNKAVFTFLWTDLTEMLLDPERRKDKNYFAIIEH